MTCSRVASAGPPPRPPPPPPRGARGAPPPGRPPRGGTRHGDPHPDRGGATGTSFPIPLHLCLPVGVPQSRIGEPRLLIDLCGEFEVRTAPLLPARGLAGDDGRNPGLTTLAP